MAAKKGFDRTPSDLRTVLRRINAEMDGLVSYDHSLAEARWHAQEALEFTEEYIELNGETEVV